MMILKTYKYKLKPTKTQINQFEQILGTCRYVYNLALDTKIYAWKAYGVSLSKYDLIKQLPALKTEEWIKAVPSQTLQSVVERMDRSYQNFFKGAGFPKFAKKERYNSFLFKQGVSVQGNIISLPKLGKIKFFNSRDVNGKIKTATINKQSSGWYISVTFESEQYHLEKNNNHIGLDVGISHLAVTSDGELIENPKHTKKHEKQLRVAQRSLGRKVKRSSSYQKQKRVVSRLHEKVRNSRKDYQHKISTKLVSENQVIVCEKLVVSNMLQNRKLSKAIADAAWHQFTGMIEYKSLWYGRTFQKVAPQYTSRDCSSCGHRTEKMPLSVRFWECSECHTEHCRDTNAAKNILARAVPVSVNVEGLPSCVGEESPAL